MSKVNFTGIAALVFAASTVPAFARPAVPEIDGAQLPLALMLVGMIYARRRLKRG